MKRGWHSIFWISELLTIVAIMLILVVPIQDYALREFKEWQRNPSPETLKNFQDERQGEVQLRPTIAIPFMALAALLAVPLFRSRRKPKAPRL